METTMNSSSLFVTGIKFTDPEIRRRQDEIRQMVLEEIAAQKAAKGE